MIVSENHRPTEVVHLNREGTHTDMLQWSFNQRYADSYWAAMEHFFDAVEGQWRAFIIFD